MSPSLKRNQCTVLCIACVTILVFAYQQATIVSLLAHRDPVAEVSQPLASPVFNDMTDAYTILIATFRRDACLSVTVKHYLSCNAREVRVKWQDYSREIPAWLLKVSHQNPDRFVIDVADGDYLSSRFKVDKISGDAVFTVDDDVRYSCDYLREAFKIWQKTPRRVVGFGARNMIMGGCYKYWESYQHIYWPSANSLFVTKGAFFHPNYLKEYFSPKYDALRQLVDGNLTAEDILMANVVALSNPPGQRWPVVLMIRNYEDGGNCSTRALGNSPSADKRCPMQLHFQSVLGFPFESTPWSEFRLWEKDTRTFEPFSSCGHWAAPWYPFRMYWRWQHDPEFIGV